TGGEKSWPAPETHGGAFREYTRTVKPDTNENETDTPHPGAPDRLHFHGGCVSLAVHAGLAHAAHAHSDARRVHARGSRCAADRHGEGGALRLWTRECAVVCGCL